MKFPMDHSEETKAKIISEAKEAKEEFEFYVCQEAIYLISNGREFRGVGLNRDKTKFFKHKIKITVED